MADRPGVKFFIDQVPVLKRWQIAVPTYFSQFLLFVLIMLFLYWISQKIVIGAIISQCIIAFIATIPYRYIVKNSVKIREKYLSKYKNLAGQKFWFHYQSYTVPLLSSSLYFPLLLKTDYFLPAIVKLPDHFITKTFFPLYLALSLGILLCIIGLIIRKSSGGFDIDVEGYIYILFPDKGKILTDGKYRYVRHPRYLGRGILAIGFGILANNILALIVGMIHFIAFASLIPAEERELVERFGQDYKNYKKEVPALFPRFGKYKKT